MGNGERVKRGQRGQGDLSENLQQVFLLVPSSQFPIPNILSCRFLLRHFNISNIDCRFSEVSQDPWGLLDCRSKLLLGSMPIQMHFHCIRVVFHTEWCG